MPGSFYKETVSSSEGGGGALDLTEITNLISEIQASITEIESAMTSLEGSGGIVCTDYWSEPSLENIEVTATGETKFIEAVTMVEKIPDGAEVIRAMAMFKFRMVENTNPDTNRLNGGTLAGVRQVIQVRQDTPGVWADAIRLRDSQFRLEGETREAGDVCFGSLDISDVVAGNGTYQFQWLLARAVLDYMHFCDVQMGIRVWYQTAAAD